MAVILRQFGIIAQNQAHMKLRMPILFKKEKKFVDILKHFWNILVDDPFFLHLFRSHQQWHSSLACFTRCICPWHSLHHSLRSLLWGRRGVRRIQKHRSKGRNQFHSHFYDFILLCLSTWVILSLQQWDPPDQSLRKRDAWYETDQAASFFLSEDLWYLNKFYIHSIDSKFFQTHASLESTPF